MPVHSQHGIQRNRMKTNVATLGSPDGIQLAVTGMTCASCVFRVEQAIKAVAGVRDASVNLATERATVNLAAVGGSLQAVADAIRNAGYEVANEVTELALSGMTCASCVARVEKALKAIPGVLDASVNLATERATLRLVGGETTVAAAIAAVEKAGYEASKAAASGPRVDAQDARDAESEALLRHVLVALIASLPILVFEMGVHLSEALHHALAGSIGEPRMRLISFALATVVQFGPGWRFYEKGFPAILRGAPDMNALVMLGTSAAYLFSALVTFFPGLMPAGTDNTYFEAGAVVVTLVLLGRWFEARAKGRTGTAIRALIGLQPRNARVLRNGTEIEIGIDEVFLNDVVLVRPGEKVAVDGEIVDGSTFIDESMITGEPIPATKDIGDQVIGGTVNTTGAFKFRATKIGADTLLAQIVRTVEAAQGAKLPIQAVVDKVTAWFVPAVMAAALATFALWMFYGPAPSLAYALVNAVAVLIIACPCAMGLATPTSIMVATGKAASMGILFRRGDALQALKGARAIAFDKTGTLTKGKPELTDLIVTQGHQEAEVLRLVASVEALSEHPVAAAIVTAARAKGMTLSPTSRFDAKPGFGIGAEVDGKSLLVGADRMMAANSIDVSMFAIAAGQFGDEGKSPLYAAIDGNLAAIICVADQAKPTSSAAIEALHALGLRVVMITGDNARTARAIAAQFKIDEVVAEVLPTGKAEVIKRLQQQHGRVVFVGDGINDAPALAQADVGIAIGTGTDIAIESADVVLMSGDLRNVPNAIALSKATIRNINQNLFWAFAYNAVLIPVAAGALYPAFGVLMSPIFAGAAMALSSVSVLSNALRLHTFRPPLARA